MKFKSSASATTTSGCFSKLFARIFRSPTFPIHLSDYTAPATSYQQEFNSIQSVKHGDSPGIVAKLMGLDFIPHFHLPETQINSGSITRSKSMNDINTREKCDQSHRRQHTSSTTLLHEFPIQLQNEDYFILSFQDEVETKNKSTKPRKKKKENHYVCENAEQPISSSSQDSSPVSVLDYGQFVTDSEDSSISEDVATIQKPNSQRKLLLQLEKTIVEFGDDQKVAMTEQSSSTSDFHCRDNNNLFGERCWQSKAEAVDSIWTLRNNWKLEDFVDINESAILDRLLEDTIDQLVEHHSTRSVRLQHSSK